MVKLLPLLTSKQFLIEAEEKELPEEFKVSERGFAFLKERVAQLNKKAAKYKVPPIEIEILKEEMIKVLRPEIKAQIKAGSLQFGPGVLNSPEGAVYWTLAKQYTLRLKGEPPKIEGYEFIARLEHTPEGNFIYKNPKASVGNLPAEFQTITQHCDLCHTNRDRNDTFVIKMEKDDPTHFPDKKAGDMLIVGRNCLQAFMPGISISGLVAWTKMIENLREDAQAATEMEEYEGGGGGGGTYYEHPDHLLMYLVATYLYTGAYVSKKQANANREAAEMEGKPPGPNSESTLSRARGEMNPNLMYSKDPHKDYPIYFRLKEDPEFVKKVEDMAKEFEEWLPTKNWDEMAQKKPDFADFFHNLKLVSKQEYLRGNHLGFYSALFQLFLRDKKDKEAKAEAEKVAATLPPSPVNFSDPTLIGKRLRDIAKESEIKRLAAGGMDEKAIKKAIRGKVWGWDVTVKKITEYEKTQTFGYGDAGIGYRISFADEFGNDFLWFASSDLGLQEGGKYTIDGTVTGYEALNKFSKRPQTRINRVKVVKDFAHPEAPASPVSAM